MFDSKYKAFFVLMAFCCSLSAPQVNYASGWYDLPYDHFSKDENLITLLKDFSSTIGIPIIISDRLTSSDPKLVNAHFKDITAEMFLMKLSNLFQIVWYYDGHMLFVYHADELKSELLHFGETKANGVRATLKQLGVWDPRFNWREMREKNLLFISGPPRYIELIKEISEVIERTLKEQKDTTYVVKVFQLLYASAADRRVTHRDKEVIIPGVASTLKNMLGHRLDSAKKKEKEQRKLNKKQGVNNSLKGTGLAHTDDSTYDQKAPVNLGEGAYIEVNQGQNSILVYDLASRMKIYEELIKSLDVKSDQIEIEVSIIDISTERLQQFGIDWSILGNNGAAGFGNSQNISGGVNSKGLSYTFGIDGTQSATSVLSGGGDYFLGKVRLLSQDGEGQVLSQPSVMTMDNVEAIIDHSTTFYVRLEGQEEVDLIPVSAGSVLKVTPRVVRDAQKQIFLDVHIQDGRIATDVQDNLSEVDDIPSVVSSTITTQALIDQDSSLLVGGYFYDAVDSSENKVPLLGDIPVVKRFFNSEKKSRRKMARMFLITPRIINKRVAGEKGRRIYDVLDKDRTFEKNSYRKPKFNAFEYGSSSRLNIYD